MPMKIPTPTCPDAGPHSPDGKLYTIELKAHAVRDLSYACAACIGRMDGARKGLQLDLAGLQNSNVNGSNPTGAF